MDFGALLTMALDVVVPFLKASWPIIAFFIIFPVTKSLWLYWRNRVFENGLKFQLIEFKMPRETTRSPRSMDQFFHAVAGMGNWRGHLGEKYLVGEVTIWFTFEIVSLGGEIHFYGYIFKPYVSVVKAAMFAAYPEVEVEEVKEDYVHKWVPHSVLDLEMAGKDLYANGFVKAREPAYPIKTYPQFESSTEEYQVDPMASFLEALANISPEEFVGIQYSLAPLMSNWGKAYEHIVEELRTPKVAKGAGHGVPAEDLATALKAATLQKSPGQTDILKAVERNLSKPAFDTNIKLLYIAPKKIFADTVPRRAIRGAFNQYNAADMNSIVFNNGMNTKPGWFDPPYVFKYTRRRARKNRMLHLWIEREQGIHEWVGQWIAGHTFNWWNSKNTTLTSEELATLYHPPTTLVVTAPHTQRVESKKMGAPAGLPIYADEKVLDRFK